MAFVSTDIDPFSSDFRADSFTNYARLRELGPIIRLDRYNIWAVAGYQPVHRVLTDWQNFSNAGGGGLTNYFKVPPWRQPSIVLEVDPPQHTRTRKVLMRILSTHAVAGLRCNFEYVARKLVSEAINLGSCDAITQLVQPFPLTVFPDAVGLAEAERENLLTYGSMVFGGFGPNTPWYEALMQDQPRISAWIAARCRSDALVPGGLGRAIYDEADGGEITHDEAGLLVRSLLSAGVDTTIDSIGLALRCLMDHPDQWRLLHDEPTLARAAFEEATRFDSSSQSLFRTTVRAVEFEGVQLGPHEKVLVFIGSAGRDPAQWDEPDRFNIRRRNIGQIGYGTGIHGCVAQMMARLEGEVFFHTLAQMVSELVPNGPAKLRMTPGLRGLVSLPIHIS